MTRKVIVVEGIDGSGKSSTVKELSKQYICKKFPRSNETYIRKTILYFKSHNMHRLNTIFFMLDQFLGELEIRKLEGTIVCDRFWLSTLAYREPYLEKYLYWIIKQIIYKLFLQPDMVIYIDVAPHKGIKRVINRTYNKELKEKIDVSAVKYLQRVRRNYSTILIELYARGMTVRYIDGNMSIQEIQNEISRDLGIEE